MKHKLIILTISLLFACNSESEKETNLNSLTIALQESIDSIFNENPNAKGIMVHIESPSLGISWSGASGFSEFKTKQTIEADQPALIASCIKTYVSATILRLIELQKVNLYESIKDLLTVKTQILFTNDGYELDSIKVIHLLTHTSGISDYWNDAYFDFVDKNQNHRWTRNEQLELAVQVGDPLASVGKVYKYGDVNYLLLTEIIEGLTNKQFYIAIPELLMFDELNLSNTWFPTLTKAPQQSKPMVHQYYKKYDWDSYDHDASWDLYGGGGIASNTEDLAKFSQYLFNSKIIKDTTIFNLIYTKIETDTVLNNPYPKDNYSLGLVEAKFGEIAGFGHGGFWGTEVMFFPELNTSIAVYVLERDKKDLRKVIIENMLEILKMKK